MSRLFRVRGSRAALALCALVLTALSSPASAAPPKHRAATRRAKVVAPAARARMGTSHAPAPKPVKPESVGSPNEGHLEGGVHVDLSHPYVRVVPAYASGDLRWGLPELVNALDRGAKAVAKRFPGSVLGVGDISKKAGGDLLRHHSHESGRDADVGFYAMDSHGKQIHAHQFIRFDGSLESTNTPGAHFDLARNWLLVQTLLTDPVARVSHIFIAEPLRERLLAFARQHGVSRALLDRAAIVMMQPHNSLPHDDHFHVRISCPSSMRGTCVELAKGAIVGHSTTRVAQRGHSHQRHVPLHAPVARTHRPPAAPAPDAPMMHYAPQEDPPEPPPDPNEAESDSADAKNTLDDSGAPRITD